MVIRPLKRRFSTARWLCSLRTVRFGRNKFTRRSRLETVFHKIVMIRNNLRVLEQKVNASNKLSEADKFDLQQYITRCYGTFHGQHLVQKKDDQFRSGAQGSRVDRPNASISGANLPLSC